MLRALVISVCADTLESSCITVGREAELAGMSASPEAHALGVTCIRMVLAKAESLSLCRFFRGTLGLRLCLSEMDELGESLSPLAVVMLRSKVTAHSLY